MLDKIIFLDEFVELQKETTQNFKYANIFICFCLVEGKVRAHHGTIQRERVPWFLP